MAEKIALKIISLYKIFISPLLGRHCRFHPTCSQYLKEAIGEFGFLKGASRGFLRIMRCHPFSAGGFDPIVK